MTRPPRFPRSAAGRHAHQGVPARGLRRRRRARRVPGPVAGRPGRPHRALPGRRPAGRRSRTSRGTSWSAASSALQVISTDLAMTAAVGRRRPGALAHLVRQPGRPPELAAVRRAARDDRALAGAAAAVEGRAARRRVRAVELVRAHRYRVGRCRHRGVERHGRRHPRVLPGGAGRPRARDLQRHRRGRSTSPITAATCSTGSASIPPSRRSSSSGGSPGRRACRCCCARPSGSTRRRSSCSAQARRTPPSSRRR